MLLVLFAAPVALAKEDVHAILLRPLDLNARPGERITIVWKLEDSRGRPFGAGDLFVRLRSAAGGRPVTAMTDGGGRLAVRMAVPEGGIGGIQFGLRGLRIVGGRLRHGKMIGRQTSRADVVFPLENDPFTRSRSRRAKPVSPASAVSRDDAAFPLWLVPLVAAGALGVGRGSAPAGPL